MAEKTIIGNLGIEPSVTAGIEQMSRDLRGHINEARKLGEISSRITMMLGRMILAYVTFEAVAKVIGDSVKRCAERERNILKLEAVLSAHNIKNKEITRIYTDMAKEINDTTIHTTSQAISAEGVLTALGVAPNLMREALNASAQLATQTGSLDSAAMMLGQALAGNTRKIGNIVYALKGVKNASPQKVFQEINAAFGQSAQSQMDGYMGQCARLSKEYKAFTAIIGKFLVPYLTKGLKYINENNSGVMSRDPAVAVPAMINEWIFGEKQWTWSIGRQTNPKVLENADKQFTFTRIENNDVAKREAAKAQKDYEDYYWDVQKIIMDLAEKKDKEAIELRKKEYDFKIEQSEFVMKAIREGMLASWNVKAKRLEVVNKLEETVIRDQYQQIRESLESVRSLNPQSAGANMAVSGLETIANADHNYFADQLALDVERYALIEEQYRQGTATIAQLEAAENNILTGQMDAEAYSKYKMVAGTFEVLTGIATMLYEVSENPMMFYIAQMIEVQLTQLSAWLGAWEAYKIGDKIGGVYAPYLKWIFFGIALAVGYARVAMILSKTPRSTTIGDSVMESKSIPADNAVIEPLGEKEWNPTINWHVYNEQKSETNFARELLPFVATAREDMVH